MTTRVLKYLFVYSFVTVTFCAFYILPCRALSSPHYLPQALLNGQVMRWHNQTKMIYFTIKPVSGVQGLTDQHYKLVLQAFNAWQKALMNKMAFEQTNDPRLTDITVIWRSASDGMEIGNQGISYLPTGKVFTNADITLSTLGPAGKPLTLGEIKATALHEIGHALGIKGHSPVATDIMYEAISPLQAHRNFSQVGLSARDESTIRLLYQKTPVYTNPVGTHLLGFRQFQYYSRLGKSAYNNKQFVNAFNHFKIAASYYAADVEINYYAGLSAFYANQFSLASQFLKRQLTQSTTRRASTLLYLANAQVQLAKLEAKAGKVTNVKPLLQQALTYAQQIALTPSATASDKQQGQRLIKSLQQLMTKV